MNLLRRAFIPIIVAGAVSLNFQSCKPYEFEPTPLSSFSVTNASPGAAGFDVIVDGKLATSKKVTFGTTSISQTGTTSIYLPIIEGNRVVRLSPDTGKTIYAEQSQSFDKGGAYSYFVTDVFTNNQVKMVRLKDDLSLPNNPATITAYPTTFMAKIRFVHTAPTIGAVDVTFARGTTDSVTITNRSYVGSASSFTNEETFVTIPYAVTSTTAGGSTYTIRVKSAGTSTVISSTSATIGGVPTTPANKIYTAYLRGGAAGASLATGLMQNY